MTAGGSSLGNWGLEELKAAVAEFKLTHAPSEDMTDLLMTGK